MRKNLNHTINVEQNKKKFEENVLMKKKRENKLMLILIIVSICTILFNTFVAQLAQVNGDSMNPTLKSGQLLVISKLHKTSNSFERGDIVIFDWNGKHLIKRLIGLPGETVQIKDNSIYINGEKIKDYVDIEVYDAGILSNETVLSENEYIFLGDNRNNSMDSREFGVVNESVIIGKVLCRVLPPKGF